jgi:hypothetical protein
MLPNTFTVETSDMQRLNEQGGVKFIVNILWSESLRLNIPRSDILVSFDVRVPDKGIDVEVKSTLDQVGDLIRDSKSYYQIKSGKFQPQQESSIKKELFGDALGANISNLKGKIKECFDKNGSYTLICVSESLTADQITRSEQNLAHFLKKCGYENPKVKVIGCEQIIGILQCYPSLVLDVKKLSLEFQTHEMWNQNETMRKQFFASQEKQKEISEIRDNLRANPQSVHIRILGEPGIGKTKFALEVTNDDDLRPQVIYFDKARRLLESGFLELITLKDNNANVLLVVDECDLDARSIIWNRLSNCGRRIRVITIYNEEEKTSGTTAYLTVNRLEDEKIIEIIVSYGIERNKANNYTYLCDGSPRVAHVIGLNLKLHPEDLLLSPDTVDVWGRFIAWSDDPKSQDITERKTVLMFLSLFKRFGFENPYTNEAISISKLIERNFPAITWARFQQIIQRLRNNKILQGDTTLYITPKALHIYLWNEFWKIHATGFKISEFRDQLSDQLNSWFNEMLVYAGSSEATSKTAQKIAQEMLSQESKFIETPYGSKLFLAIAEGLPGLALEYLKKTFKDWDNEKLSEFRSGRREIIYGLEKIVVWPEFFEDGAEILLKLAEAENETWANNATGVFSDLFLPISKTGAIPNARLKILKDMIDSGSKKTRLLAIESSKKALHVGDVILFNAEGLQGLKEEKIWKPTSAKDIDDYQLEVWKLLCTKINSLDFDEQQELSKILLSQSFGLSAIPSLGITVFDCISNMNDRSYVDKKEYIVTVMRIVENRLSKLDSDLAIKWKELNDNLSGKDLVSQLRRYVGMYLLDDVTIIEDKLSHLAKELIKKPEKLEPELRWLTTKAAENAFRFGYRLGEVDKDMFFLNKIVKVHLTESAADNVGLLGGYLWAIYQRDPDLRDREIQKLLNTVLRKNIPQLVSLSDLTEFSANLVLELIKEDELGVAQFNYFLYGGAIRSLSESSLSEWTKWLLQKDSDEAVWIAMELWFSYYIIIHKRSPPKEQTLRLLTHYSFFSPNVEEKKQPVRVPDTAWTYVAKEFVKIFPKESIPIMDSALRNFGSENSIVFPSSPVTKILTDITRNNPSESWNIIKRYLGPPVTTRSFWIERWLKGEDYFGDIGALSLVPPEDVWRWVNEDPTNRARYLASFIPKTPFRSNEIASPRELLVRYGSDKEVARQLHMNLNTGMVSEPEEAKIDRYTKLKEQEDNKIVKSWIDDYIGSARHLDKMLKDMDEREFPN